jgi:hypothetical protein
MALKVALELTVKNIQRENQDLLVEVVETEVELQKVKEWQVEWVE